MGNQGERKQIIERWRYGTTELQSTDRSSVQRTSHPLVRAFWSLNAALWIGGLASSIAPLSTQAHTTDISGDVAGTWHVEPDHNPKAGEPAQVWVALTQKGGDIIPLDQCDCQLMVYEGTAADGTSPLLEPTLEAIGAETYDGIPGATLIFPQVGQYQLQLIGAPKAGATFQPFDIEYTVTVARGKTVTEVPVTSSVEAPDASTSDPPVSDPPASDLPDSDPPDSDSLDSATPDSDPSVSELASTAGTPSAIAPLWLGVGGVILLGGAILGLMLKRQSSASND